MIGKSPLYWVCADCHNVFGKEHDRYKGDCCEKCYSKKEEDFSKFDTKNWENYLKTLKDKEWNYRQLNCSKHSFEKVPKSGRHLGIPLWRCIYCEGVVQAN